ncbi:MAG: hypothetical protein Q9224_006556 [Gallowayella concinna]
MASATPSQAATTMAETQALISLPTMPTEIIMQVFATLRKSDLKSKRLVCHHFDAIIQPILFDKVVISNAHSNDGLFREVIDKPKLANHVKTLVLDVPRFRDIKLQYYMQHLVWQIANDIRARQLPSSLKLRLDLAKWFRDPGSTHEREKLLAVFGGDIVSGYERYMEHFRTQDSPTASSFDSWPNCFQKCRNIQRLEVQTEWQAYSRNISHKTKSLLPVYPSSGFVARHWDPVFLRPMIPARCRWDSEPFLSLVFTTLSAAQKPVPDVVIGKGCVIRFCKVSDHSGESMARSILTVFEHLTSLTFWMNIEKDLPQENRAVNYIAPALKSACKLRYLRLGAIHTSSYADRDMDHFNLLPLLQDCVWPDLVTLELFGTTAPADTYLKLLRHQKSLKSFTLGSSLVKWGFDSKAIAFNRFVEEIGSSLDLTAFSIESLWKPRSASDAWQGFFVAGGTKHEWSSSRDRYIVHGGAAQFAMLN